MFRLAPLLVLLLLLGAVPAQAAPRSVSVTSLPGAFEATSLGEGRTEVRFDLAEARLEYGAVVDVARPSFDVRFERVVQFSDADGDGRFSIGDPVLRSADLASAANATLDVGPGSTATARFPFESGALLAPDPAVVVLSFDLPTDVPEGGGDVRVQVQVLGTDPASHHAVLVRIRGADDPAMAGSSLEPEPFVSVSWGEALATQTPDGALLAFSQPAGTSQVHSIAIARLAPPDGLAPAGAWPWYLAAFAGAAAVAIPPAAKRLRRRA
jgi:hypothetical protein